MFPRAVEVHKGTLLKYPVMSVQTVPPDFVRIENSDSCLFIVGAPTAGKLVCGDAG